MNSWAVEKDSNFIVHLLINIPFAVYLAKNTHFSSVFKIWKNSLPKYFYCQNTKSKLWIMQKLLMGSRILISDNAPGTANSKLKLVLPNLRWIFGQNSVKIGGSWNVTVYSNLSDFIRLRNNNWYFPIPHFLSFLYNNI